MRVQAGFREAVFGHNAALAQQIDHIRVQHGPEAVREFLDTHSVPLPCW